MALNAAILQKGGAANHNGGTVLRAVPTVEGVCALSYRPTPKVPKNQNAEVNHKAVRMANSVPPASGSVQSG